MAAKKHFTSEQWDPFEVRYRAGAPAWRLAREAGCGESTLYSEMTRRGASKQAARRAALPDSADGAEDPRSAYRRRMAVQVDLSDPATAALALDAHAEGLLAEGYLVEAGRLLRMSNLVRARMGKAVRTPAPANDDDPLPPRPPLDLHDAQTPPPGDWKTWLFLGGRGAGKTQAGAEWLADRAETAGPTGRLALVGATLHDVREVMIGGPSGLLSLPRWNHRRPRFEPSRRRLTFPNGCVAHAFSAEDPDSLRGPQFEAAWADEFCAWARPDETLAMLRLGLRRGDDPRLAVTTTPRPIRALKTLRAEAGCVVSHAPTSANTAHLAPAFIDGLKALYGGTRREAQELEGLMVEPEGGLFRAEDLATARAAAAPAGRFERIVVAVDPAVTRGGDACGIVVAGRLGDRAWVLADRSQRGLSPDQWARRAIEAMDEFGAEALVVEVNQGGEMVAQTLRTQRADLPVVEVRASRGKVARAEPVAALYEQGRVGHVALFRELEEELMLLGTDDENRHSLDRADALVWAVSDLLLGPRWEPRMRRL